MRTQSRTTSSLPSRLCCSRTIGTSVTMERHFTACCNLLRWLSFSPADSMVGFLSTLAYVPFVHSDASVVMHVRYTLARHTIISATCSMRAGSNHHRSVRTVTGGGVLATHMPGSMASAASILCNKEGCFKYPSFGAARLWQKGGILRLTRPVWHGYFDK